MKKVGGHHNLQKVDERVTSWRLRPGGIETSMEVMVFPKTMADTATSWCGRSCASGG
jgi:hypothetical protein